MKGCMKFTDIHINVASPEESLVFPGPRRPTELEMDIIAAVQQRIGGSPKDDFMIAWNGWFFRGRRDRQVVDGEWLRLRRMSSMAPKLDALPSPLPSATKAMLLSPMLSGGGLVYVIGAPGSGKTTTCSAALTTRLEVFGGFAYTVEDPPEMPLNGWHGDGYCSQTWVAGDSRADWQEAFRGVLRSQPSGTHCILYVGEVRDAESASALIRAASSGFLVFATGFGTDIPAAIDSLVRLAAGDNDHKPVLDAVSSVLRLVLHQRITDGQLSVRALVSANARTAIANKIRAGMLSHLEGDLQFQANQLMSGVDIFQEQARRGG